MIKVNLSHLVSISHELMRKAFLGQKFRIDGKREFFQLVRSAEKMGEGSCIFVTAHLGSWDLLGYYVNQACQGQLHALGKVLPSRFITNYLEYLRSSLGMKILWTGQQNFQKDLVKVFRNKDTVGFIMDQKPHGRVGVEVDFLGKKTSFVKGPAYFAKRYKKPIVVAFCFREGNKHYRLQGKILDLSLVEKLSVEDITQALAREFSQEIRRYPHEWVWSYKRWKKV